MVLQRDELVRIGASAAGETWRARAMHVRGPGDEKWASLHELRVGAWVSEARLSCRYIGEVIVRAWAAAVVGARGSLTLRAWGVLRP